MSQNIIQSESLVEAVIFPFEPRISSHCILSWNEVFEQKKVGNTYSFVKQPHISCGLSDSFFRVWKLEFVTHEIKYFISTKSQIEWRFLQIVLLRNQQIKLGMTQDEQFELSP